MRGRRTLLVAREQDEFVPQIVDDLRGIATRRQPLLKYARKNCRNARADELLILDVERRIGPVEFLEHAARKHVPADVSLAPQFLRYAVDHDGRERDATSKPPRPKIARALLIRRSGARHSRDAPRFS